MKKLMKYLWEAEWFKKVMIGVGIIFSLITMLVVINPEPFVKLGYWGVFLFGILGPSIVIVPRLALEMNVVLVAAASALGMMINDSVTWWVGKAVGDEVINRTIKIKKYEIIIRKFGYLALLGWSFIPFPYDLIGLVAGYLEIPLAGFVIVTFIGRFLRFLLMGYGVVEASRVLY